MKANKLETSLSVDWILSTSSTYESSDFYMSYCGCIAQLVSDRQDTTVHGSSMVDSNPN